MNRTIARTFLPLLLLAILGVGACSSEAWEELPSSIATFISQYFPGSGVKSYNETDNGCIVKVNNGATLKFDKENEWTEIDGNGVRLPEVMMYDQLPPALFDFLQSTSQQGEVYAMSRDKKFYKLTMLDTVITFNIQTGAITYPGQAADPETE